MNNEKAYTDIWKEFKSLPVEPNGNTYFKIKQTLENRQHTPIQIAVMPHRRLLIGLALAVIFISSVPTMWKQSLYEQNESKFHELFFQSETIGFDS